MATRDSRRQTTSWLRTFSVALAGAVSLMAVSAHAQTASPSQQAQAAPAKAPASWVDGITTSFWIEGGMTLNNRVDSDRNFGRLFDDRTDQPQLNQATVTVQRKIDSTKPDYDLGFKLQAMYGTDARYTHFLHEFQNVTGDSFNQFDIVEANLQLHTPWFTDGGYDIKVGQYPTLEGIETIDPTSNYLYSHSFLFNFGIPLKHTGMISVLHATPMLDIYAGVDSGVNTSLGDGDNNSSAAFHGGFGLNLLGGNLTVLATTHIGPENAKKAVDNGLLPSGADKKNRYLNDVATVWKLNDKLQLMNDLNYVQDDCTAASAAGTASCRIARGYGMDQYVVYQLNDMFTLVGRAEVWRDEEGFYVAQFNDNNDFVRGEEGEIQRGRVIGGGRTTYGGLTVGVNIKPSVSIPYLSSLVIRPEARYDASLNGTHPFGDGTKANQFTVASDVILQF